MLRVFIVLFLIMELSGCFIAPGMKMESVPSHVSYRATNNQVKPNFIPIDVALIRQMKSTAILCQDEAYYYHVGPHDILDIHVWDHPELQGSTGQAAAEQSASANSSLSAVGFLVNTDGDIFYPMIGTVHVGGKTVEQVRVQITTRLKRYIRNPQLSVRVTGFRSKKIYVMGEVYKPGVFPVNDAPVSITDAINLAGGLDLKSADPSHIFVIRGDYAHPDVYWLDAQSPNALLLGENFRLKGDDVVFISTAGVARWNRAIDQILPTIQTVWFTWSVVNGVG
jgi:polysaccharide export outer membrane protein